MLPFRSPTAYFPPATWLSAAVTAGEWQLEAHENYQKGGWRNRCRIVGPNGPQLLSIPLEKGKNQRQPIRNVRISYVTDWWRVHEQAIRTAYGRAPFFEFYAEDLFAVGRQHHPTLWAHNRALLDVVLHLLHAPVAVTESKGFVRPGAERFVWPEDLPASRPPYPQVFEDRHGFTAELSVLDVLFCLGPGAVG